MAKKTALLIVCLILPLLLFAQNNKWKMGTRLIDSRVMFISPGVVHLYPFMDRETNMIGFARASSSLFVVIPPVYEDAFNAHQLLFPVKKDGKWGAMDLGERYFYEGHDSFDPIIPCIFDEVEIIDEYHAKVTRNEKSEVIDVRDGDKLFNKK